MERECACGFNDDNNNFSEHRALKPFGLRLIVILHFPELCSHTSSPLIFKRDLFTSWCWHIVLFSLVWKASTSDTQSKFEVLVFQWSWELSGKCTFYGLDCNDDSTIRAVLGYGQCLLYQPCVLFNCNLTFIQILNNFDFLRQLTNSNGFL